MTYQEEIDGIIKNALAEDIKEGDITTSATVPDNLKAEGVFLVKQDGIAAGFNILERIAAIYDPSLIFQRLVSDGKRVKANTKVASLKGKAASILAIERTALNYFQRISGIATLTNSFAEKIKHTKATIIDTRKTAPGLRVLDKLAVKLGGGENHRMGLFDMFLIKDNHIAAMGSISEAVRLCKENQKRIGKSYKIEVETTDLKQVEEAIAAGVDVIMLDNFDLSNLRKAVNLTAGRVKTEASGMISLENVKEIAETGVDFISIGALTHSVKALDISLKIQINN
jgi:nicotinate-nucleotide pyrophosphorylase (carboxylating)